MGEDQGQNGSVFISYSRKDKEFVRKLYDALTQNKVKCWVDWEGIPLSADWMDEITRAVAGSDTFIVVISPDWLASKVCAQELELALQKNKKLVPILYRPPEKGTEMHEKLAATNWVYLRPEDDFDGTLPKLIEAINTDLDWVRQHTRLIQRATEWDKKNRSTSFLLHGEDLDDGEGWMNQAAMQTTRQVLPLQADYIVISRKEAVRRQRMTTIAISFALVVSILLAIAAVFQWRQAGINADLAKRSEATAIANEKIAKENEKLAKDNEKLAKDNEARAVANEKLAKDNETQARAQRNAAEAQHYQSKGGNLDISTLLAIHSWNTVSSPQAEDILRQNLSFLPSPVKQLYQGDPELDDNMINSIEFSPDGRLFASAGNVGSACVWKAENGEQVFCDQHEQNEKVTDAVFTLDGKQLVTSSTDGLVRFVDVATGQTVNELDLKTPVNDLDLSPDQKWLAIARTDKTFMVINLLDPQAKQFVIQQLASVTVVKFSPDSQWLGVAGEIGKVDIWVPGSSYTIHGPDHGQAVFALAFSPDSSLLVSVGKDSRARVAKAASGAEIKALVHDDWVEDIAFSPDGKSFATASDDDYVWVWDVGTLSAKFRLKSTGFVQKVEYSPNGQWIASTGYDQTVCIWNAAAGNKMLEAALNDIGTSIAFSPDGKRVLAGDHNGNINIWNVSLVNSRVGYIEFPEYVHELRFNATENWFVANTDDSKVWRLPASDLLDTHEGSSGQAIINTTGLTYALEVSLDSKWVAASEEDNERAVLYNTETQTQTFLNHGSDVEDISFAPDSASFATGGLDGKVIVWNMADGSKKFELPNSAPVLSVDISADGRFLVAGLQGRAPTQVWDLADQTPLAQLNQNGDIAEMEFSQNGKWLATGDSLGQILIWNAQDLTSPTPFFTLNQNGEISSLAFSADEHWLAAGSREGFVHLWDLSTGKEMARIPHSDAVTGIVFSQDGNLLFTASRKVVQIWDVSGLALVSQKNLVDTACSRLFTNLSQTEWENLFPADPYQLICPNLPKGQD